MTSVNLPNTDLDQRSVLRLYGLIVLATAWMLAVGTVVAAKFRAQWDWFVSIHRRVAELGVPDSARRFDFVLMYALAAFLGSYIATRIARGSVTGRLGLQHGMPGWITMAIVALLPMVVGGGVLGWLRGFLPAESEVVWPRVLSGVVRAPLAEELLFRGLLIGVCAAAVGWRGKWFWMNATLAALLFASVHIQWNMNGLAKSWPTLLVTGAGGMWYAWLLARWQSLWVPMTLHAGMNLGWMLAGAGGGAGGGGWMENVLRVVTIGIATWWTIKKLRAPAAPGSTNGSN